MHGGRGIVTGFVAGLAVMGGAVLLLRDDVTDTGAADSGRAARMEGQLQRLEEAVGRLSALAAPGAPVSNSTADAPPAVSPPSPAVLAEEAERKRAEARASVAANTMVDQALQAGQWTRAQQRELDLLAADLGGDEHGRLLARISAAINRDELQIELP